MKAIINLIHVISTGERSVNETFKAIAKNPHKNEVIEAKNIPLSLLVKILKIIWS